MKKVLLTFALFLFGTTIIFAQVDKVLVVNSNEGVKLNVNGHNFMINGMNWDYFPIGTNYTYSLWAQSDDFIKAALDTEMPMLKNSTCLLSIKKKYHSSYTNSATHCLTIFTA